MSDSDMNEKKVDCTDLAKEISRLIVPGDDCSMEPVGKKFVLYTRGAQRLCQHFGLTIECASPSFSAHGSNGGQVLIASVVVQLWHAGESRGSGVGAASSQEKMFRMKDVNGKSRLKDDGPNAMAKMAANRALVAAFITTTATGEVLTQDVMPSTQKKPDVPEKEDDAPAGAAGSNLDNSTPKADRPLQDVNARKALNQWFRDPRYSEVVKEILGEKHWAHATVGEYEKIAAAIVQKARENMGNG